MAEERFNSLVTDTVEGFKDQLSDISHKIWSNPELCYKEFFAHNLLTTFLRGCGFTVTDQYLGVETAFRAEYGSSGCDSDGPVVCFLCEYDALPEIGHACGHNLISVVGLAGGLALKAALQTGRLKGKVVVMGTPAEEGGGGKVILIEKGAFKDVDLALMAHPAPVTHLSCNSLAVVELCVTYHGQASHAAAFPWEGINALDAAVACYVNLSMIRQQCKPEWRVHAIISNGGERPNIIPEISVMEIYYRAMTKSDTDKLGKMVQSCINSAAQSSGCSVEITTDCSYSPLSPNKTMANLLEKHCASFNISNTPIPPDTSLPLGSTDMGNVTEVVPGIHPFFDIYPRSHACPRPVNHTRGFTEASATQGALQAGLDMGKSLALTAIDVISSDDIRKTVTIEFETLCDKLSQL